MTDKAGPNWTKRGVMVAIGLAVATMLCMTLNNAPTLVPFLEERGYDAAWLMPALQWLQRARWVIVAVAAFGLLWMLAPRFRAALARWEWGRQRYARALAWLARSVRDDVLLMLSEKTDSPALVETVVGLSAKALRVLGRVLVRYDPVLGRTVVWRPSLEDEYQLVQNFHEDFGALQRAACHELVEAGLFSSVNFALRREARVTIDLDQRVLDAGVLRVREWVEEELLLR